MNRHLPPTLFNRWRAAVLVFGLIVCWLLPGHLKASPIDLDHRTVPAVVFADSSLKLAGTAVTGDPDQSIAVIADLKNRRQWSFREGDRAGDFLIKAIYRGHIVVEEGGVEKKVKINGFLDQAAAAAAPARRAGEPPAASPRRAGSRQIDRVVDRGAVAAALANPEAVLESVDVQPARLFNRDVGFRISDFAAGSIFPKMGLRSGDLLLAIDECRIAGPQDAAAVWEALRQGGDVDLTIRRRARTYHINLLLQ